MQDSDPEFPGEKPGSRYCSLASQRTVTRPVIPDRLWRWTGRIQAVTLSLRAGQQVTGTVLNSNGLRTEQRLAPTVSMV